MSSLRWWILLLALLAYVVSLFLPGIVGPGDDRLSGFICGLFGIFASEDTFAWYANLAFFIACFLLAVNKYLSAMVMAVGAILLGLDTFRLERFVVDEAGHTAPFIGVGSGYVFWQMAFVCVALGAGWLRKTALPLPPPLTNPANRL